MASYENQLKEIDNVILNLESMSEIIEIAILEKDNSLEPENIYNLNQSYGIGTSNGASMVNKLGKETEFFNGIAPIVSQQLTYIGQITPSRPMSIFQVIGENDTTIPPEGGAIWGNLDFLSAEDSAENWANFYGCSLLPNTSLVNWGSRQVQESIYSNCQEGREVRHHVVEDGVRRDLARPADHQGGVQATVPVRPLAAGKLCPLLRAKQDHGPIRLLGCCQHLEDLTHLTIHISDFCQIA